MSVGRSDAPALLEGLNPEQREAVTHGEGPLLVLAGAGSGKTRVLTRRLAWLVAHGVPPASIVALTFTNKAAGEMKERVAALLSTDRPASFVGTFHAYGVRLLRRFAAEAGLPPGFVVFDADDQLAVVKAALKAIGLADKSLTPRTVLAKISHAKNAGLSPETYPRTHGDYVGTRLAEVHVRYEKALAGAKALDFDDLLVRSVRLLQESEGVRALLRRQVRHLLVDEYQDTNRVQAALVKLLVDEPRNVFAVGDEDQSIYRWRGADVGNILEFARQHPGARTVRLERNYRSTAPILDVANAVIAENRGRLGKTLRAVKGGGEKVTLLVVPEERDEAREVVARIERSRALRPGAQLAVLFRTNAQSRPFEEELGRSRIPYQLVGGTRFYERAEVKDALAYLRLALAPDDDVSFRRVVNVPARGVGAATLEALEQAAAERRASLFRVLESPPAALTERARKALLEFRSLVLSLGARASRADASAADVVGAALGETGLAALYEGTSDLQDEARRENLDALLAAAREHERASAAEDGVASLSSFLDAATLRSDADDVDERRGVLLMTLHAAKGLEFDEVFLAGLEDGSLPHVSCRSEEEVEEERRLCYVGMTRARDRLTLSRAARRLLHGEWTSREPSPFLDAVPGRLLVVEDRTFAPAPASPWAPPRGGYLFPDYEGESQERGPERSVGPRAARVTRGPARPPAPRPAPVMKRTPPPASASGFRRGSRVVHSEYGRGVVMTVEGSGDAEKLTVYFDRAGRKKFVARFSSLSPG